MPCTRTGIPLRSIPAGDGHVGCETAMKRTLINTGAVLLIATIVMFALIPALRGTQDPSREQIQDIQTFQRDRERRNLLHERPLVFLRGLFCGAGLACVIVGLTLRERNGNSKSQQDQST